MRPQSANYPEKRVFSLLLIIQFERLIAQKERQESPNLACQRSLTERGRTGNGINASDRALDTNNAYGYLPTYLPTYRICAFGREMPKLEAERH